MIHMIRMIPKKTMTAALLMLFLGVAIGAPRIGDTFTPPQFAEVDVKQYNTPTAIGQWAQIDGLHYANNKLSLIFRIPTFEKTGESEYTFLWARRTSSYTLRDFFKCISKPTRIHRTRVQLSPTQCISYARNQIIAGALSQWQRNIDRLTEEQEKIKGNALKTANITITAQNLADAKEGKEEKIIG